MANSKSIPIVLFSFFSYIPFDVMLGTLEITNSGLALKCTVVARSVLELHMTPAWLNCVGGIMADR